MTVKLYMQCPNGHQKLVVHYNPSSQNDKHDVYNGSLFLGQTKLKAFFVEGWECVKREVV